MDSSPQNPPDIPPPNDGKPPVVVEQPPCHAEVYNQLNMGVDNRNININTGGGAGNRNYQAAGQPNDRYVPLQPGGPGQQAWTSANGDLNIAITNRNININMDDGHGSGCCCCGCRPQDYPVPGQGPRYAQPPYEGLPPGIAPPGNRSPWYPPGSPWNPGVPPWSPPGTPPWYPPHGGNPPWYPPGGGPPFFPPGGGPPFFPPGGGPPFFPPGGGPPFFPPGGGPIWPPVGSPVWPPGGGPIWPPGGGPVWPPGGGPIWPPGGSPWNPVGGTPFNPGGGTPFNPGGGSPWNPGGPIRNPFQPQPIVQNPTLGPGGWYGGNPYGSPYATRPGSGYIPPNQWGTGPGSTHQIWSGAGYQGYPSTANTTVRGPVYGWSGGRTQYVPQPRSQPAYQLYTTNPQYYQSQNSTPLNAHSLANG